MIRVGLISNIYVVRRGLRTMLEEIAATRQRGEDSYPLLVAEGHNLSFIGKVMEDIDILLVTDDALEGYNLEQLQTAIAGQVPLLLLVKDSHLIHIPTQLGTRVWGVIPLDSSVDELEAVLIALSQGFVVFSPSFLPNVGVFLRTGLAYSSDEDAVPALTGRENEVLQLLAQGLANKQIAASLHISEHTVKFHIASIYSKFGVTNRTEAVRLGIQQGIVML